MSTATKTRVRYEPEERPGYLDGRPELRRRDPAEIAREVRRRYCRRLVREWKRRQRRGPWIAAWVARLQGDHFPHGYRGVNVHRNRTGQTYYSGHVELNGRTANLPGTFQTPESAARAIAAYLVDRNVNPEGA